MIRRLSAPTVTQTGAHITNGSPTVTGLATSALEGALRVVGAGIPRNTYVQSIDSASQVTLTGNATATSSGASLTFGLEPVMLQDAKDQLRIDADFHRDDVSIARNIAAARIAAEDWYARAFITQTFRYTFDGFDWHLVNNPAGVSWGVSFGSSPASGGWGIKLPRANLVSVESLVYLDDNGDSQTLDEADYQVVAGSPGIVYPAYGLSWPSHRSRPDAVAIDFTAGYGATADSVPETVKEALCMLIDHFYNNRSATVTSSIGLKEAPLGVQTLLSLEDWGYRG